MAKFYVGCRVRIVGCENPIQKIHVGKEGMVVSKCDVYQDHWDIDCALRNSRGGPCSWDACHLEPIIPEGHQVISWEEMADLWTPERIEA